MKATIKNVDYFYDAVQVFYCEVESGTTDADIRFDSLSRLTYPMKVAADQVNLRYQYGCLYTGNNQYHCRYFFIPGERSTYVRNGRDDYIINLKEVYLVKVERSKPLKANHKAQYMMRVIACIEEVDCIEKLVDLFYYYSKLLSKSKSMKIPGGPDVTLNRKFLLEFLKKYVELLCQWGVVSHDNCDYVGWVDTGKSISYIPSGWISHGSAPEEEQIDRYLPMALDSESPLWFAASIFSLLKPVYDLCEIKCSTRFALQVLAEFHQDTSRHKSSLRLLELQAHMWCDFREWPADWRHPPASKFRKSFGEEFSLEFHENCGFPVMIFGYYLPDGEEIEAMGYDDDAYPEEYSPDTILANGNGMIDKNFLSRICSADCLPILIPGVKPKRDYPKDMCLTMQLRVPQPEKRMRRYDPSECRTWQESTSIHDRHERINQYYISCMEKLSNTPISTVKKNLQNAIKDASSMMSTLPGKNQGRTEQLSIILSTLYYVRNALDEKGQETKRLCNYIQSFEHHYLGIASIEDFANFVEEQLERPINRHSVIFAQDSDRIYLRYKDYWRMFQQYCADVGIVLGVSAASFRRNVLATEGLIQPQYQVSSGGKYPRYDYRKKVDDIEESVLNLSKEIFKYSRR